MRHRATEKGVKGEDFAAPASELGGGMHRDGKVSEFSDNAYSGFLPPDKGRRFRFWSERFWFQVQDQWRRDCDFNNAMLLWSAFLLALGAATYIYLPDEPVWWLLLLMCLMFGGIAFRAAKRGKSFTVPVLFASFLFGLSAACLHGQFGGTPILTSSMSTTFIGRLEQIEYRSADERWTIAIENIEGLAISNTPRKLLLIRRAKEPKFQAGDRIEAWARLIPLQRQAFPGSFDYGRYLWARQIGGQGYLGRRVKLLADGAGATNISLWLDVWMRIEQVRSNMASYLFAHMEVGPAGLASALVVGKRDYLTVETKDALRLSGLAHILAISGLHMALVTLTIFGGVRLAGSFIEPLVLRYDIKKLAAWAALLAATCYLVLSGHGVATIRAYVMMVIFLGAILAGRPALTMHNVALALIILVLFQPFSIVEPGLQMSFGATVALIAGYRSLEGMTKWRAWGGRFAGNVRDDFNRQIERQGSVIHRGVMQIVRWFAGLCITALLAGLATTPFSIAFFHQMAPMGLIANLMAMPILSLIVMPSALISALLIPVGLQQWSLAVMEWGLEQIIYVAQWVVDISPQIALLVAGPAGLALASAVILTSIAIHPNRLAVGASLIAGAGLLVFNQLQIQPDIWIAENGRSIAVRDGKGHWVFAGIKEDRFLAQALLKADGDTRALPSIATRNQNSPAIGDASGEVRCDGDACRLNVSSNGLQWAAEPKREVWSVSLIKTMRAFAEECAVSDIVISALQVPESCSRPLLVVDKYRLKQHGSHFLWLPRSDASDRAARYSGELERKEKLVSYSSAPNMVKNDQPVVHRAGNLSANWLVWPDPDLKQVWHLPSGTVSKLKIKSSQPYAGRPWQKTTISEND